jgi:transposase
MRLVPYHRGDYASEYEMIRTIAERMSLKTETVRCGSARPKRGGTPAASASEAEPELRAMRRKNAEL